MAEHNFIEALAEHWQDVLGSLESQDVPLFAEHVTRTKEAAVNSRASMHVTVDELMFLLGERLPDGHPVREAIPGRHEAPSSSAELCGAGGALVDLSLPGGNSTLAAIEIGRAEDPFQRLLSARSLTEHEVRNNGVQPERRDLIRLTATDRKNVLPAFQFDPAGQPVPIVTEVNQLLDAADDPWGVADWWLGENPWLGGVPADLLGEVEDSSLMGAARAALPYEFADLTAGSEADPLAPPGPPGSEE
jgi:hypothetical protein